MAGTWQSRTATDQYQQDNREYGKSSKHGSHEPGEEKNGGILHRYRPFLTAAVMCLLPRFISTADGRIINFAINPTFPSTTPCTALHMTLASIQHVLDF